MRTTTLPGTSVPTSVLGLGTAQLFWLPEQAERLRLLAAAHDAGVRHFDTAPMYGLGRAEAELGRFARRRRDQLVIATKFGIAPTSLALALSIVQRPVRRLMMASPAARQKVRLSATGPRTGPVGRLLYSAPGYDARSARNSLEASLRALRTDYVDLFLLHEPRPDDVRSADICGYLEQARDAGLLRAWGVAGEFEPTAQVARHLGRGCVLQVREDLFTPRSGRPSESGRITFGALGRALPRLFADLGGIRHDGIDLGGDRLDRQQLAALLLRAAMQTNSRGTVLIGTTNERHLRIAVEAATRDPMQPDPAIDALTGAVAAARVCR